MARRRTRTMATDRPDRQLLQLLEENPDLSARDMRDLLMEYGAAGTVASALVDDRLQAEWKQTGQR